MFDQPKITCALNCITYHQIQLRIFLFAFSLKKLRQIIIAGIYAELLQVQILVILAFISSNTETSCGSDQGNCGKGESEFLLKSGNFSFGSEDELYSSHICIHTIQLHNVVCTCYHPVFPVVYVCEQLNICYLNAINSSYVCNSYQCQKTTHAFHLKIFSFMATLKEKMHNLICFTVCSSWILTTYITVLQRNCHYMMFLIGMRFLETGTRIISSYQFLYRHCCFKQ